TENVCEIGITSGLSFAIALIPMIGIKHESSRVQINIRVMSALTLVVFLFLAIVMCFISVEKLNIYYTIVGIIALIYLGVLYSMLKIKDI
ncbi:MAG: hypothetical protein IKT03_03825, partial [Muribaculaceae bacterium]|nr:hypothetical protein [Muribaculaceae bacterium]